MTLDPTIFQALQLQIADARDLLPRREHPYLALNEGQLPRLSEQDNLWGGLAQAIDGWLTAENASGRSAAVTPDVLSHHVLKEMSGRGAPSAQVLVDRNDNFTILRWPRQSRAVALWWAYPVDAAAASRIAPLMSALSDTKWVLLVAATSQTMKGLEEVTGPDASWSLLSGAQQAGSSKLRRPGQRQIRALPGAAAYCKFAEVMVRAN